MDNAEFERLKSTLLAAQRISERNSVMQRLDLLAAAWRWSSADQATILHRTVTQLASYRQHDAEPDAEFLATAAQLERIQFGLWASLPYEHYAGWWRQRWSEGSPIGANCPFDAAASSIGALPLLIDHFSAMLSGDFSQVNRLLLEPESPEKAAYY